ncbi:hypothetical protein LCGC14_0542240 [marine sediment metagenome]|uniref:Helix-turn-helix domain-containing protein n=1 Tax=marine sediment metagenome TaxID=412755 RepID=A0A0F9RX42_9ZZZZ
MNAELLTTSDIADRLHEPQNRVAYILKKHRIKHEKRIGVTKVFDPSVVAVVKAHLYNMQIQS